MMRFSEFCTKDVISVDNGELLGMPCDLEFDEHYQICMLYVMSRPSGMKRLFPWFFHGEERMVRISQFVRVGKDVIIVSTC